MLQAVVKDMDPNKTIKYIEQFFISCRNIACRQGMSCANHNL